MTSGNDLIANNWQTAECQFYAGGTGIAANVAIASLVTGQFWASISASAAGLAFDYAAGLAGCKDNPAPPGGDSTDGVNGCGESSTPATIQAWTVDQRGWTSDCGIIPDGYKTQVTKIVSVEKGTGGGPSYSLATVEINGDSTTTYQCNIDHGTLDESQMYWRLIGGDCIDEGEPLPPDAIGKPTTIEDDDCTWTFTPKDSYIDASGAVRVYYVVEANNDACGGPFAYWSGPNGPTPVNPNPPDESPGPIPPPEPCPCGEGDCPDPCPPIPPPIALPEKTYQLMGVCETVLEGEPQPVRQWPIAPGRYEQALASRIDALASMLQQHLNWRTPTCQPEIQPLEGDYRTIAFVSDENSPEGKSRLSKRFRYRSSSGVGLSGVVEHWRSFTWAAGAVCVSHKGSTLGSPQVWAATAEEGKRVIRHAAGEAGVDADQTGRWLVSGSTDPRYGMPGTMRVNTKGGYYWITSRLGPDQRPLVQES